MFIKEAWFWRGFQSAIFYYISCAPCTRILDQRKKKQNAARAKAERLARKAAQAKAEDNGLEPEYDHPLPSSTNPFWEEEMRLGPGPPPKRRNNRHGAGLDGQGKNQGSKEKAQKKSASSEMAKTNGSAKVSGNGSNSDKSTGASDCLNPPRIEVPPKASLEEDSDTDWNRQRYQREDESLWGLDTNDDGDDQTETTGGIRKGGLSQSKGSSKSRGPSNYYTARNPAVNDLHPPVVSTAPTSRTETQWMLQPPPRAKIMEGKERENRSRSGTGSTRSSRASSKRADLGRQLSNRTLEVKLGRPLGNFDSKGDHSLVTSHPSAGGVGMSRSEGGSNRSLRSGQWHDRDTLSNGHPSPNSLQPSRSNSQRTAAPPPIALDNDHLFLSPSPNRPGLQTIPSTSLVKPSSNKIEGNGQIENTRPDFSGPLTTAKADEGTMNGATSSTTALQELGVSSPTNQINRSSSLTTKDEKKGAVDQSIAFPGAENGWGISPETNHSNGGKEEGDATAEENGVVGETFRHRRRAWSMDI